MHEPPHPADAFSQALSDGIDFVASVTTPWQLYGALAAWKQAAVNGARSGRILVWPDPTGRTLLQPDRLERLPREISCLEVKRPGHGGRDMLAALANLRRTTRHLTRGKPMTYARPLDPQPDFWVDVVARGEPRRLRLVVLDEGMLSYLAEDVKGRFNAKMQEAWGKETGPRSIADRVKEAVVRWTTRSIPVENRLLFTERGDQMEPVPALWDDYRWAIQQLAPTIDGGVIETSVLYVSQPVEEFGVAAEDEIRLVQELQTGLEESGRRMLVKLHPRQDPAPYQDAGLALAPDGIGTMEDLMVQARPRGVIGLFSTGLVTAAALAPSVPVVAVGGILAERARNQVAIDYVREFDRCFGRMAPAAGTPSDAVQQLVSAADGAVK